MANILIVDNSAIMRRMLKSVISQAGHKIVAEALNGADAIYEYAKHTPDLVLMELNIPVSNGAEVTKEIMEADPKARIVIIASEDDSKLINQAMKNGAKNYLNKPISPEEMNRIFAEILPQSLIPDKKAQRLIAKKDDTSDTEIYSKSGKPPYERENYKNEYSIKISKKLVLENVVKLLDEVEEILESDPGKIIIDFGETTTLDEQVLEKLGECIIKIKGKLGTVNLLSVEATMKDKLERQISHAF